MLEIPVLVTERLRLTALTEKHFEAYASMLADDSTTRFIGDGQPLSRTFLPKAAPRKKPLVEAAALRPDALRHAPGQRIAAAPPQEKGRHSPLCLREAAAHDRALQRSSRE